MKALFLSKVFLAAMVAAVGAWAQNVWNGTVDAEWYWDNTSKNEYTITTAEQLAGLAQLVNGGNSFSGKTIKLGANIMLNDTTNWEKWGSSRYAPANQWNSIGSYTDENNSRPFSAIFDGGGYTVNGVYISSGERGDYKGLFGFVSSATIKNLGVIASYVYVPSDGNGGGLAGKTLSKCVIINCYVTGNVDGEYFASGVGGLVGSNNGTITNCYVTGNVKNGSGLVGTNYGSITNCYVTGNVKNGSGLVGSNSYNNINTSSTQAKADTKITVATITNSYATGNVDGGNGLVGSNSGSTITNSYATGNVDGGNGLVGTNYTTKIRITKSGVTKDTIIIAAITNCYATGNVDGGNGLVGTNDGTIIDCYATGNVNTGRHNLGSGLVGINNNDGTITNCYATGNVMSGDMHSDIGGLTGWNYGAITNSFAIGNVKSFGNSDAGGLTSKNSGQITNCYATGNVEGRYAGGFTVKNGGKITNCYAMGNVNGSKNVGGFTGENGGQITNCYSAGKVSGTTTSIGGLVGFIGNNSAVINSCYDRQASGQVDINKGEPKSTAQMKQQATFAGWDFAKVWAIDANGNNGYPYLRETAKLKAVQSQRESNLQKTVTAQTSTVQTTGSAQTWECGVNGGNVTATFANGTLIIRGKGKMANPSVESDFIRENPTLWSDFVDSITNAVIEDGVTNIGAYTFWGCANLTSVTIPNSVTDIEYGAFAFCKNLTSVTIPESVIAIGTEAFAYCKGLTSIFVHNPNPVVLEWSDEDMTGHIADVFEDVNACLYVPQNSIDAYRTQWRFNCVKSNQESNSQTVVKTAASEIKTTNEIKTPQAPKVTPTQAAKATPTEKDLFREDLLKRESAIVASMIPEKLKTAYILFDGVKLSGKTDKELQAQYNKKSKALNNFAKKCRPLLKNDKLKDPEFCFLVGIMWKNLAVEIQKAGNLNTRIIAFRGRSYNKIELSRIYYDSAISYFGVVSVPDKYGVQADYVELAKLYLEKIKALQSELTAK